MLRSFKVPSFGLALIAAASTVHADIIPFWSTPNNVTVNVPFGGATSFHATGNVSTTFDALLVVDTSGSMNTNTGQTAPNGGTRRGDWAIAGAQGLVDVLDDGIRLGLVEFDLDASLVTPLAALGHPEAVPSHRQALKTALQGLDRVGGTDFANAIKVAAEYLVTAPGGGNSKHLVVVSDGDSIASAVRMATMNAIGAGIDSVNTVGLPGADAALLEEVAVLGKGVFVDGRNLGALVEGFKSILDNAETLAQLDVILPDGSMVENIGIGAGGEFAVEGTVRQGNNVFRARATSDLGNVAFADVNVIGVGVPEPTTAVLIATAVALIGWRLGFGGARRRF